MFGWRRSLLGLSSACVFGLSYAAHAAEPALGAPMPTVQGCAAPIARVIAIQGEVRVRTQQQAWQLAAIEQALCAGDELQVAAGGRGALRLGATTLPLDQNTHLILRGHSVDGKTLQIELVSGNINVATDASSQIQLFTPHGKVSTTGGDFAVSVTAQQAALSVFGGKVAVSNPEGNLELLGDETAFFAQLSAPKRDITVKARDSVQWVVQYPALLPSGAAQPSAWAEAARQYEQGRVLDALIALDQVPAAARNADYYNYRANIYLLAGRAADAMADIEQAKKLNQNSAETWALQAIFDLGQNNGARALVHAEKAVKLNPDSPAAQLAFSYALQANRRPEDALASASRMVALAPDNALGHSRVAELELARGARASSLHAAQRGVALAPNSADAQSILGFAYLSEGQDSAARSAFEAAVRLNSADPRARMGLGLVRIRQGQLQAGREDLELAASLDPENALLRAYLGRAYDAEGRSSDAMEQYARAKHHDAQDPTPYFFSALQLATSNAPVTAKEQMQEALARNETRTVYRGQTLLEEDRALRSANVVALNRTLGFDDAAREEASAALAENPQSGVLHRALGDSLATLPNASLTRQSEYLQASLRAPLGALPTPLSLSDNVRAGGAALSPPHGFFQAVEPGQTGYNEYGAIFSRQPWQAQIDLTAGGKDSRGDQTLLSGSKGGLGWSLSHLQFRTEGFGEFKRLDNTVWRGVLQADISPATRVHLEGREYDSDRLSILNPADPFNYTPQEIKQHQVTWRVGLHQRIGDSQELLFAHAADYAKYTIDSLVTPFNPPYAPARRSVRDRVYAPEMQYRYHGTNFDFLIGQAYIRSEEDNDYDEPGTGTMTNSVSLITARAHYGYARWTPLSGLSLEMGLARERQQNKSGLDQRLTSPKWGLRWELIPGGALRLASIRGVNRFQASGATLEPTQVAGFNQFYDDRFARRTVRRGVGWDQRLAQGVSWGVETSRREIGRPKTNSATPSYEWSYERQTRVYANWAIPSELVKKFLSGWEGALSLSHDHTSYLRPANDTGAEQISDYTPRHMRLGAKLFQASGFEVDLAATKIRDHGTYQLNDFNTFELYAQPFSDSFWVWDAALSYQLPGKRGKITLGGLNLGDRRNSQYLEMDPLAPRFAPARYVYGKLLLNF